MALRNPGSFDEGTGSHLRSSDTSPPSSEEPGDSSVPKPRWLLVHLGINPSFSCPAQYFSDLRNSIVNSQPPEKQQAMHLCFENLMEGIERNLLTKNRDRSVRAGALLGSSTMEGPL